jgi:GntR family transcriptional regulator / MocR family aminotransferase
VWRAARGEREEGETHRAILGCTWYGHNVQLRSDRPYQLMIRLDGRVAAPLHEQIFDAIRARILGGELPRGMALPSSRQLAADLGVARSTVLQSFAALADEGYIVTHRASATRVAPQLPDDLDIRAGDGPPASAKLRTSQIARALRDLPRGTPRLGAAPRAFRPGVPALDLFPAAAWARASVRCHARASAALLDGGDPAGDLALRKAIAEHVSAARGVRCEAAQVFVTSGTQAAVEEILRLVIDPGERVWIENPCYLGARRAVLAAGGRPVPIPVDDDGLDVDAGIARCPDARAVIVSPSHHYPLGVTLDLTRRMALLRWARRAQAVVIEDDYDSEFRHHGRPLTALQGLDDTGRTVYVGTFSKTLFPGLRIGFFVAPPSLVDVVAAARTGPPASALEQATLASFMASGAFARHVRRMRLAYRERGEALVDALTSECAGLLTPHSNATGLQLWAALHSNDRAARDAAARHGIELAAVSDYYLGRPRANGLVFGFGGVRPAAIRAAVRLLAEVIA